MQIRFKKKKSNPELRSKAWKLENEYNLWLMVLEQYLIWLDTIM